MGVKSICRCVHKLHMSLGYIHKTMVWVHIDDLDGVNAAGAAVDAQLVAVPDAAQQVATMTRLVEALDSLWQRPVREVASLLQRAGVRVFCEDGEVAYCELV